MELKFSIAARINRPVEDVFEAVVDPDKLSTYFTTGGAKGRLEEGVDVTWDFHDYPGAFPVTVIRSKPNEQIILQWDAGDGSDDGCGESAGYQTTMTMDFKALEDGRTLVTISEHGWKQDEAGLKASYSNCEGWTHMLCALKAWIEHGINLREGFYR